MKLKVVAFPQNFARLTNATRAFSSMLFIAIFDLATYSKRNYIHKYNESCLTRLQSNEKKVVIPQNINYICLLALTLATLVNFIVQLVQGFFQEGDLLPPLKIPPLRNQNVNGA